MKLTGDDVVFSLLHSCVDGLRSDRIVYYLYAFQKAGLDLKYRYRVQARGISCRDINTALNTLVAHNKIECSDGWLSLTPEGYLYYDNVLLTAKEWDSVNSIKALLDSLSEEELFFVCVTDIVVYDMLKRSGADGLKSGRSTIERAVQNLSSEYSSENFNTALGLMRQIGEGAVIWQTTNE